MAANLAIECADRSVRWYLTPGQTSRYEIIVINQSGDETVDCQMALDDPPNGGVFDPPSFNLRPRERKTVSLTFAEETQVPRDQHALISVRDPNGIIIASLERGLISAGGTDCTVTLSWKEPIVDGDEVRGFVISCAIKSLSASPGMFALQFTPHPTLEFVDVAPVKLQPGQTATVAVPILWKRTQRDADGLDHPRVIEIGVAVSQGRRTGRLSWDTVEAKLAALRPAHAAESPSDASAQQSGPPEPSAGGAQPKPADAQAAIATDTSGVPGAQANGVAPSPLPLQRQPEVARAEAAAPPSEPGTLDDDDLMSLLVGKPVSPPAGWRSPGREAPDAEAAPPPSIFAKTPPAVTAKPPTPPRPEAPPLVPPAAFAPPRPTEVVPPAARPQLPGQPTPPVQEQAVPPAARPHMQPQFADANTGVEVNPSTFEPSVFEGSVVGPPPSRSRTLEVEKEHRASERRAAAIERSPSRFEGRLPALVVGGTALIAIVLVAFFLLHPYKTPTVVAPTPAATMPPPVVLENVTPTSRPKPTVKPGAKASAAPAPSIAPSAASSVAQQAAQHAVATSAPAPTTAPVVHTRTPVPVAQAPRPTHPPVQRPRRIRPHNPTAVVAIQGIFARYGPAGHAVRVLWGASSQASAHVALSDDRGSVLSSTDITGQRQNAVLYIPRAYHGSVYVQVVSIGYQGERVTQSTSLPPFSP